VDLDEICLKVASQNTRKNYFVVTELSCVAKENITITYDNAVLNIAV